jgi:hypothetical protein
LSIESPQSVVSRESVVKRDPLVLHGQLADRSQVLVPLRAVCRQGFCELGIGIAKWSGGGRCDGVVLEVGIEHADIFETTVESLAVEPALG